MDRIEINGVWYVKEEYVKEDKPTKLDLTEKDVTFSKSCVYETNDYCWEANLLSKDNGKEFYSNLEIEFTDIKIDTTEYWDNPFWLNHILDGDQMAIKEAKKYMSDKGLEDFTAFLKFLKKENWLK
jgi:hypothetical protein